MQDGRRRRQRTFLTSSGYGTCIRCGKVSEHRDAGASRRSKGDGGDGFKGNGLMQRSRSRLLTLISCPWSCSVKTHTKTDHELVGMVCGGIKQLPVCVQHSRHGRHGRRLASLASRLLTLTAIRSCSYINIPTNWSARSATVDLRRRSKALLLPDCFSDNILACPVNNLTISRLLSCPINSLTISRLLFG